VKLFIQFILIGRSKNTYRYIHNFFFFFRKRWFNFYDIIPNQQDTKNSSIQFCQAIQLTITEYFDKNNPIIFGKIKHISSWVRITHLKIDCSKIPMMPFIELLCLLPNNDSLRVVPMAAQKIYSLTEAEIKTFQLETRNNNITKMNIGLVIETIQVIFFVDIFPHIKYLEVNCSNDINLEVLVQCILIKIAKCITPQFCSLCRCAGQINDEIIEKLNQIMARKDFLHEYTINGICDRIYFQWK